MLGPPNQGSEMVDRLGVCQGLLCSMGRQVSNWAPLPRDLPKTLGPVRFELGVIAGTRTEPFVVAVVA